MHYNVKSYGAVGDARLDTNVVTTAGTGDLTSISNPWTLADVGKICWGVVAGDVVIPLGTIDGFTDAGTIHVSTNATNNAILVNFVWATQDDTAAFTAAFAAAIAGQTSATTFNNSIWFGGGFAVSGRIYQNFGTVAATLGPALIGDSRTGATLFPMPTMTIPGDGRGALIDITGYGQLSEEFGVYGCGFNFDGLAPGQAMVAYQQAFNFRANRFALVNIGSRTVDTNCLKIEGIGFDLNDVQVQGNASLSVMTAGFFTESAGLIKNCLFSNHQRNLVVRANHGRTPIDAGLIMLSGVVDEGTVQPTQIIDAGTLEAYGTTFYGGGDGLGAVGVDATSKIFLSGCNLGRFGNFGGGGRALDIAAGGYAQSRGSTFRANAASVVSVHNDGEFDDALGNKYANWNTGAEVPTFWRDAFTKPNEVRQFRIR